MELKDYVSNLDDNIYTVNNIPEEIIAVIFAYVSRSPKSFRDNLLKVTQEKAKKFHEKWVLEYGHASVAEHVCLHFGIEKVSRIFTSELQLSNKFLSFTEYSQRYQQISNCDFYVPENGVGFENFYEQIYAIYAELLKYIPFESARYVLPLGTYSALGMTTNARALAEALSTLKTSKYKETIENVNKIASEASNVAPTLIRVREPKKTLNYNKYYGYDLYLGFSSDSCDSYISDESYTTWTMRRTVSEACFHQLLRHRSLHLRYSYPLLTNLLTLQEMIPELETSKDKDRIISLFEKAIKISKEASDNAKDHKDYYGLNLHSRRVCIFGFLDDIQQFIALRNKENAQYEIRNLAKDMLTKIEKVKNGEN